ncbi:helix-turn-helix domain-containing protein [Clostridium sporogenes]|nr:helix-turn-helix domain-containing protein [Clostridium sporogenes]NFH33456.1 helix-turn-helix domain-containing protein [Clostridium sporogenes]NFH48581.1 helix-turn-helix domain-containing protein [Clostridium sporogenes]NFL19296.1 helix-turn-helix domain-containing protein [Clostridium sporogenes]NFN72161.1 helix-turn-helix domain-containing protein [Clostridium sporogenes]
MLFFHRGGSMSELGNRLKESRNKSGLSLKEVYEKTGITDSRLSKIERGQIDCTPDDLKRLAHLYNIQIIPLYELAGYLTKEDIVEYQFVFQGVSSLDEEEMQHIQSQIDFLNKKRKVD